MSIKPDPREVGIRLRAIFHRLELNIQEAADELDEPRNNLANCVNGYQLPRPQVVYELERMLPGVTLQWVYFGDDRLVPGKLSRELTEFVERWPAKAAKGSAMTPISPSKKKERATG